MNLPKPWPIVAFAVLCFAAANSRAQNVDVRALAETLKSGGYVILFRHGATNRDQADTDPLNHDNVSKQRQLSDAGREVAKQIERSFKTLQIPIGKVYTSKFYRAIETGRLLGATEVTTTVDLTEGGLVVSPIENDRRAEALRRMVATVPEAGKNTVLVTHKPNIIDALGKDWFDVKEGEASVFQPSATGKPALIARLQATEWANFAK